MVTPVARVARSRCTAVWVKGVRISQGPCGTGARRAPNGRGRTPVCLRGFMGGCARPGWPLRTQPVCGAACVFGPDCGVQRRLKRRSDGRDLGTSKSVDRRALSHVAHPAWGPPCSATGPRETPKMPECPSGFPWPSAGSRNTLGRVGPASSPPGPITARPAVTQHRRYPGTTTHWARSVAPAKGRSRVTGPVVGRARISQSLRPLRSPFGPDTAPSAHP